VPFGDQKSERDVLVSSRALAPCGEEAGTLRHDNQPRTATSSQSKGDSPRYIIDTAPGTWSAGQSSVPRR